MDASLETPAVRLAEIRDARHRLAESRLRLREEQAFAFSPETAARVDAIGSEIRALEDEARALRAGIRFGPRERILERAQREQRLLNELELREHPGSARRVLDRASQRAAVPPRPGPSGRSRRGASREGWLR